MLYHTHEVFNDPRGRSLLKTLWKKGENASKQHFFPFPKKCFVFVQDSYIVVLGKSYTKACQTFVAQWQIWYNQFKS